MQDPQKKQSVRGAKRPQTPRGPTNMEVNVLPEDTSWREACRILEEELAGLPDELKGALILCSFQGRTTAEAADELQVSARTVRDCLRHGRELLQKRLIDRGLALDVLGGLLAAAKEETPVAAALQALTVRAAQAIRDKIPLAGTFAAMCFI
jgi:hypothetical protein